MTIQSETVSRLQSLLDLYRDGYQSTVVDQTVGKLISNDIAINGWTRHEKCWGGDGTTWSIILSCLAFRIMSIFRTVESNPWNV